MSQKIRFVSSGFGHGLLALCLALGLGCGNNTSTTGTGGTSGSSSASSSGGKGSGGSTTTTTTGGAMSTGGASGGAGGKSATGGTTTAGTTTSSGGMTTTGGNTATGGRSGSGGASATGGNGPIGGNGGGTTSAGGSLAIDAGSAGNSGGAKPSAGCGKAPSKLKNNPAGSNGTSGGASTVNTISVGGQNREFLVRWPADYKNDTPYRIVLGLHGAGGTWQESGGTNYGLWPLSNNTTIFVSLSALAKFWDGPTDLTYTDEVLKLVESDLCIDTSRVMLEGFSQGAAMSWYLTCSRPGVFRAVVGHSGGGVNPIPECSPVAYFGSLGTQESGNGQNTQTDRFAKVDGCTIETLPTAPSGSHVCTPYKGCQKDFPVTWCSFDGGHGFEPKDSGAATSWMPKAVWDFLSPL